jgi:hypothetical protein
MSICMHVAKVCFKCYNMLQVFHVNVACHVFQVFSNVLQVFQTYVVSVFVFRRMLQVFHLDIAKYI